MIAGSLIPDEIYNDLPENMEERFLVLATAARERMLQLITGKAEAPYGFTETDWKRQYIHEVTGIAHECDISGFVNADAASSTRGNIEAFDSNLAILLTRLRLRYWTAPKELTVSLSLVTKESIRADLEALRARVNASNLSDKKKEALHRNIDSAEAELDKTRTRIDIVASLAGMLLILDAGDKAIGIAANAPQAYGNTISGGAEAKRLIDRMAGDKAQEDLVEARRDARLQLAPPLAAITDQSEAGK